MKIDHVYRNRLTNALHLQFNGEAKDLVEKFPNVAARIAPQFDVFRQSVEREDACFKIIRKSDLSALKEEADAKRDAILVGIGDAIRTALRHFKPEVKEAARRLKIVLDAYNTPTPMVKLPYDAETASVDNLLQEFSGKLSAEVQLTGLAPWTEELAARNADFAALAKGYNVQQAEKPPFRMTDVRRETDAAFDNVVLVLNALIVMEGEAAYAPFVAELNELAKHYHTLVAQHEGRNRKKGE
jgi:hypothetical protein